MSQRAHLSLRAWIPALVASRMGWGVTRAALAPLLGHQLARVGEREPPLAPAPRAPVLELALGRERGERVSERALARGAPERLGELGLIEPVARLRGGRDDRGLEPARGAVSGRGGLPAFDPHR